MEGQPQFDPLEQCARCERPAPQAVPGPEGQSDQGWTTYESEQQLIVDVPYPDAGMLRPELATAIGEFEGIVSVQADPQVTAPAIPARSSRTTRASPALSASPRRDGTGSSGRCSCV